MDVDPVYRKPGGTGKRCLLTASQTIIGNDNDGVYCLKAMRDDINEYSDEDDRKSEGSKVVFSLFKRQQTGLPEETSPLT